MGFCIVSESSATSGDFWRWCWALPRTIRDAAYDFVAPIRYRIFGTRDDMCPIVFMELRSRFDR